MYTVKIKASNMEIRVQRDVKDIQGCIASALDLVGNTYKILKETQTIEISTTNKGESVLGRQEPERIGVKK